MRLTNKLRFFLFSLAATVVAALWFNSRASLIESEPYDAAITFIRSDSLLGQEFGEVVKIGMPSDKIDEARGSATFTLWVEGDRKASELTITLIKTRYSAWKVKKWQ